MAFRDQFTETVLVPLGPGGSLVPVEGIGTTIYTVNPDGSEGAQSSAYADRLSDIPASSMATDESGTVSYYLDPGDYNIHFDDMQSPPRIGSFVRGFTSKTAVSAVDITAMQSSVATLQSKSATQRVLSIPATETITSTTYALAPTPDQLLAIPMAQDGLFYIFFQANWNDSALGVGRAAIFIDGNQLQVSSNNTVATQAAAQLQQAGTFTPLSSCPIGLISTQNGSTSYPGDVTTGQAIGIALGSVPLVHELGGTVMSSTVQPTNAGGPCVVFASGGPGVTHDVSIRYKASSGNVQVRGRKLRVITYPFTA